MSGCQFLKQIDSLNSELAKERQKRDASTAEHHSTTSSGSALKSAEASGHTRRHAFTAPVGPDRLSSLLGKAGPGGGYGQPSEYVPQGGGCTASGRLGSVRALHTAKEQEEETLRVRLKQVTLCVHLVVSRTHSVTSVLQHRIM